MSGHRGLALIVTLWVLVILSVICLSFAHMARVEGRLADNYYQRSRASYMAEAGLERMLVELEANSASYTAPDGTWVEITSEDEEWPFEDERFEVRCTDECAKLNLNTATEEMLAKLPGMTPEIVDGILDWRDGDDEPRPEGAEQDYYATLNPRYACANRPFLTVEELLLVKGVTPELMYGTQEQTSVEQETPRLADLVTIYSLDRDVDAQGQARLNINSASEEQLKERLGDVLEDQAIQAIIQYREQSGEFKSVGHLWNVPGMDREKMKQVVDRVTVRGGEQTAESVEPGGPQEPQLPQLPELPGGPGAPSAPGRPSGGPVGGRQAPELLGGLTPPGMPMGPEGLSPEGMGTEEQGAPAGGEERGTGEGTLVRGLINLNTAPAEVLLTLPEMTEEAAQAIVSARESQPFTNLGEVLEVEQIDPPLFQAIANYVTVRSRSFRCVARGEVPQRRAVAELTAIIEAGSSTPRIIYFKRGDSMATGYRSVSAAQYEGL